MWSLGECGVQGACPQGHWWGCHLDKCPHLLPFYSAGTWVHRGCSVGATDKNWMGLGGGVLWCLWCVCRAKSSQQMWLSQSLTTLQQKDRGEACKKCFISVRRKRGRGVISRAAKWTCRQTSLHCSHFSHWVNMHLIVSFLQERPDFFYIMYIWNPVSLIRVKNCTLCMFS